MAISITVPAEVLDALREEGETDVQVVARCIQTVARAPLRGKQRATEKAKLTPEDPASVAAKRAAEASAVLAAEATADNNVETLLNGVA